MHVFQSTAGIGIINITIALLVENVVMCSSPGFHAADVVTGGTVTVEVKGEGPLSWISFKNSYDLCHNSPNGCPIPKGKTSLRVTKKIPTIVPPVSLCCNCTIKYDHSCIYVTLSSC